MNGGNSPRSPTVPIPTRNNTAGTTRKTFGPEGCPAMANGRRCGETRNLQIIQEFRRLYEDKMRQIDDAAGGDCVQAKINLQQEWIRDLTDQNEMLVRVVEELEVEAAERVIMLEDKLQQSAKCACEHEKQAKEKDKQIKELEEKIKKLMETNDVNGDANKACQELKKSMLDMRDALTAEVAEKHDTILCLRREAHMFQEQCRKAEQQTHFKDDIIKELRKEIKQLKLQRTKKSRSPRTLKRCEQHRLVHPSRTDPDTNIRNIKDGTIVIKDTATVGDNIATQIIKEKYSDPCNQTVVYICETVTQRRKSNSHDNAKIVESSPCPNRSFKERSGNCEVSQDNSKRRNVIAGDGLENSINVQVDYPRDAIADGDVSRDSGNLRLQRNYFVYPSIQETCIKYSRDILEMLNNHSLEEKKDVGKFLMNYSDENEIPTNLDITNEPSILNITNDKLVGEEIKAPENVNLEEVKVVKDALPEPEDSSGFLSNTLSKCERYFLDMYRNKCRVKKQLDTSYDETYLKRFRDCFDGTIKDENNSLKLKQYEISKRIKDLKEEALNLIMMGSTPNAKDRTFNCRTICSQTSGFQQLDKKTQTSEGDILSYVVTCDQSVLSNEVPQVSTKEKDVLEQSVYTQKDNEVSHDNPYENQSQPVPQMGFNTINTSAETENVSTEEVWNNSSNFKSGEISFEEAEMAAYSTPFYEDIPQYYQPEMLIPSQVDEPSIKYEEFDLDEPKFFRINAENRRLCGIPRKVPLIPLRQYVVPSPQMRQKTLRKIPMPQIHRAEIPLSVRTRSLPTCAEVYASRHDLQKPMRLRKLKKVSNCPEQFVDVGFVMDDGKFVKRMVPNGYMGLSARDKMYSGRRLTREECFDRWPRMNNTY